MGIVPLALSISADKIGQTGEPRLETGADGDKSPLL
jgi:hypothetical protein